MQSWPLAMSRPTLFRFPCKTDFYYSAFCVGLLQKVNQFINHIWFVRPSEVTLPLMGISFCRHGGVVDVTNSKAYNRRDKTNVRASDLGLQKERSR